MSPESGGFGALPKVDDGVARARVQHNVGRTVEKRPIICLYKTWSTTRQNKHIETIVKTIIKWKAINQMENTAMKHHHQMENTAMKHHHEMENNHQMEHTAMKQHHQMESNHQMEHTAMKQHHQMENNHQMEHSHETTSPNGNTAMKHHHQMENNHQSNHSNEMEHTDKKGTLATGTLA
jgi:hypothetical protein